MQRIKYVREKLRLTIYITRNDKYGQVWIIWTIQIYKSIRVLVIFAMTWANDNGPKEYNMKKLGLSCAMSIVHAGAKLRYNQPCIFTLKASKPLWGLCLSWVGVHELFQLEWNYRPRQREVYWADFGNQKCRRWQLLATLD